MTKIKLPGRRESKDEQWVKHEAFKRYMVESIKVGFDGWPDRLYLIQGGRPLWIEHKRNGEVAMTRQEYRIQQLKRWGYDAEIIDDRHEALEAIRRAVEAASLPRQKRRKAD